MSTYVITASIVIYRHREDVLKAINSFLGIDMPVRLYLLDNSPDDFFIQRNPELKNDSRVEYIFNNANLGYGRAHNIALKKAVEVSKYHLVMNPDIEYQAEELKKCIAYLDENKEAGMLMPKVLYPNGELQYLCKKLPSPADLIFRRFMPSFLRPFFKKSFDSYMLKHKNYDEVMEIPNMSGCFMLFRTTTIKQAGFFDERYFMYLEDVDLCRKVGEVSKTIYYPNAKVIHGYAKESYKNRKLLFYHIQSAIKYFNKWGWFFDKERARINAALK